MGTRALVAAAGAASLVLVTVVTAVPASSAAATPPGIKTREIIGTSVQGRPIVATHRTHEGADRTLLVIGNIHGDETAGMRVIRRLKARRLPANLDLWLIRTANPDGTAANRRTNAHGVDLNRNFPHLWRSSAGGPTWSGPSYLSEPESVALRRFVRRIRPRLTVTFHQPLFGVGANDKAMGTIRKLARGMALPVDEFHCTGICHGTFTGWANKTTEGEAVTVEFGSSVRYWHILRAAGTLVRVGSAT